MRKIYAKAIPSYFTLGCIKWSVQRLRVCEEAVTPRMGDCSEINCTIRVFTECLGVQIPRDKQEETFIHELVHAILFQMSHPLARNESFVQTFASFLYQYMSRKK